MTQPPSFQPSAWRALLAGIALSAGLILAGPAVSQPVDPADLILSLPKDWSSKHVIHTRQITAEQAEKLGDDPRLLNAWILHGQGKKGGTVDRLRQRAVIADDVASREIDDDVEAIDDVIARGVETATVSRMKAAKPKKPKPPEKEGTKPDWNVPIGPVGVAKNMYPAKYNFDVTAAVTSLNCTDDFVVFALNTSGATATSATGSGSFATNPTVDGATITVNGVVFTAVTGTPTTNQFQISGALGSAAAADRNATAANFAAAVTAASTATLITAAGGGATGNVTFTGTKSVQGTGLITGGGTSGFTASTNLAGFVAGQANLVAYQNLYSGTGPGLCGLAPTVKWAYFVNSSLADGHGGQIGLSVSPVLSLDGTKVAFVEADVAGTHRETYLHILKWKSDDGSVAQPVSPTTATNITTCTAPCMVSILLDADTGSNPASDTNSSPFYVYGADTLYVGNDRGRLFKVTNVFSGTPAASSTGGFGSCGTGATVGCLTIAANVVLTSPVLDAFTNKLFIGGANGILYRVDLANNAAITSTTIGAAGGIVDAPIVDVTNQRVYAFSRSNGTNAVAMQTDEALGSVSTATLGAASTAVFTHSGAWDDDYFNWPGGATKNTGKLYACGNPTGQPTLYAIPFSGVSSVNVTTQGAGYTSIPTVSFAAGTGSGAVGSVAVGVSSATTANACASGTVTFNAPPAGGVQATATVNGTTTLTITNGGSGYTAMPTFAITGCNEGAQTVRAKVTGVSVTASGGAYDPSFAVAFSGGSPTVAAAATASASGTLMASGTPSATKVLTGASSGGECSPISEFVTNSGADMLFVGSGKTGGGAFGQVQSLDVSDGTLAAAFTSVSEPNANAGTSGIVVDNMSNAVQAASIYFTTLASGSHAVSILSATRSGTTATITTNGPHNLQTGQSVTVAGVGGNANFNVVTATIAVIDGDTFTYTMANAGGSGTANTGTATVSSFLAIKLTQTGLN